MPKALATLAGQALACIEESAVVEKVLAYLQGKDTSVPTSLRLASRAPPRCPVWLTPSHPSPHSNGNDPNGSARIPVGLTSGIAAHKVNSAAGGREGPLGEVVRAKVNGWIANAEWGQISVWWQGAGPFVSRGSSVDKL